ncbi:MAG: hypothetical protein ACXADX_05990 [Candidatus Hodarchaeales archaeon]|jgi:hypothetical protein
MGASAVISRKITPSSTQIALGAVILSLFLIAFVNCNQASGEASSPSHVTIPTRSQIKQINSVLNQTVFANATPLFANGSAILSTIENGSLPVIWRIEEPENNSLIVFEIADSNPNGSLLADCVIYASQNGENNISSIIERSNSPVSRLRSNFTVTDPLSKWFIVFHPRGRNGSYTIFAKDLANGYDFATARKLTGTGEENGTFYFSGQWDFWNITLKGGQRAVVSIHTEDRSIINGLRAVWQDTETTSKKTDDNIKNEAPWEIQLKSTKPSPWHFFLVLKHGYISEESSVGQYRISVDLQPEGFNFDSAYDLALANFSLVSEISYPDARPYYKFQVPARTQVSLLASELEQDLLEEARIEIFGPDRKTPVASLKEEESSRDGQISGDFIAELIGVYYFYLEIVPVSPFSPGSCNITIILSPSPRPPEPFLWRIEAQIVTLAFLGVFPIFFYYQRRKISMQRFQQNVGAPIDTVYKALFDSGRFEIYGMIPDRLLKTRSKIMGFRSAYTVLLNPIDSEETMIMTSRKARLWENILPFLIVLSIYLATNSVFLLWSADEHFLPFEVTAKLNFFLAAIITISLTSFVLALTWFRGEQYRRFEAEIEEIIHSIIRRQNGVPVSEEQQIAFVEKQMERNIAYVRVLWNQAKAAFKEQNFSLFVIKADAAVKKLLETRFMQIYGYSEFDSSIEFRVLCEQLRSAGFDIPKTKKIEHHRKLRNYIVHSSRILDEDESAETMAYYAKFLGRLGLRA